MNVFGRGHCTLSSGKDGYVVLQNRFTIYYILCIWGHVIVENTFHGFIRSGS